MSQDTSTNKYDARSLLQAAIEQKPGDFKTAFDDVLGSRAFDAVAAKRDEIAQGIFAEPEVEDEETGDE